MTTYVGSRSYNFNCRIKNYSTFLHSIFENNYLGGRSPPAPPPSEARETPVLINGHINTSPYKWSYKHSL